MFIGSSTYTIRAVLRKVSYLVTISKPSRASIISSATPTEEMLQMGPMASLRRNPYPHHPLARARRRAVWEKRSNPSSSPNPRRPDQEERGPDTPPPRRSASRPPARRRRRRRHLPLAHHGCQCNRLCPRRSSPTTRPRVSQAFLAATRGRVGGTRPDLSSGRP